MAISFDKALGIHQQAVGVRAGRAEVLASNIANADTPGYKARDIDFTSMLSQAQSRQSLSMNRSHKNHIAGPSDMQANQQYRTPLHPDTGDGNTVDLQTERNQFMQNALQYEASLGFLDSKFSGLKKALRGE